jgi:hypothetical protein
MVLLMGRVISGQQEMDRFLCDALGCLSTRDTPLAFPWIEVLSFSPAGRVEKRSHYCGIDHLAGSVGAITGG